MSWINELPAEIADSISDEIKTNPTINNYKSLEDALKGHIETKSAMGRSIRIPGEDAGDADREEFYNKLINNAPDLMKKPDFSEAEQAREFWRTVGLPEEPDKYTIPEEVKLEPEFMSEFQKMAFEANLTDSQMRTMATLFSKNYNDTVEAQTAKFEESRNKLKETWGMTVDERISVAKQINEKYFPGRDFDQLTGEDVSGLYEMHVALTGKGPQAPGQQEGMTQGMTPAEAREQVAEIMNRVHDPKSELTREEVKRLMDKTIELKRKYYPEFAQVG